jgi:putative addiction module CopG family antidote
MEVQLTPDQEAFIKHAIDSGRLHREEDAVREALSLWEERERARVELRAAFDEAEVDLEAGHYTDYTNETLPQLADELKREARALRDNKQSC